MPIPPEVQAEFDAEMDKYEAELTEQLIAAGRADDEADEDGES